MELKIRIIEIHPSIDFFKNQPTDKLSMFFICGNISFKIEDIENNIQNKESITVILNQTKLTTTPIKFTLLHNDINILGVGQLSPKSDIQWHRITTLKQNLSILNDIRIKLETILSHCFNNKNIQPKNNSKDNSNVSTATTASMKNLKYNPKTSKISNIHKKLGSAISFSSKKKKFLASQSQKNIAKNLKNSNKYSINTINPISVQGMDIGWLCNRGKNEDFLVENFGKQTSRKNLDYDNIFDAINELGFSSAVINTENFKSPKSNEYQKNSLDLRRNVGLKSKSNFSKSQKFFFKNNIKKYKTIYGFNKVNINKNGRKNRNLSQKETLENDYITLDYKTQKSQNNISITTNRCYNTNKPSIKNNNQPNINQKIEEQIIDQKFKEKLINDINIRDNSFINNNTNNTEKNTITRVQNTLTNREKAAHSEINPIENNLLDIQFNEAQMLSNLEINSSVLNMLMKYEKTKNDFFLLYSDKYIKKIKNCSLVKELKFMLRIIFDFQKQYQNIYINFQKEYNNYYKQYKNNQRQYILMNKIMRKLNDNILKYIINDERNNLFENITTNVYYNPNTLRRNPDFSLWNNLIENINMFNIINITNNSFTQNKNKIKTLFMNICEKHVFNLNKLAKGFYINLKNQMNDSMDNTSNKQSTNIDNYSVNYEEEIIRHNKSKSIEVKNFNNVKNINIKSQKRRKLKDNNSKRNNYKNIVVKKNEKESNKNKNVLTTFTNRRFESLEVKSMAKIGTSLQNTNKKKYFNK